MLLKMEIISDFHFLLVWDKNLPSMSKKMAYTVIGQHIYYWKTIQLIVCSFIFGIFRFSFLNEQKQMMHLYVVYIYANWIGSRVNWIRQANQFFALFFSCTSRSLGRFVEMKEKKHQYFAKSFTMKMYVFNRYFVGLDSILVIWTYYVIEYACVIMFCGPHLSSSDVSQLLSSNWMRKVSIVPLNTVKYYLTLKETFQHFSFLLEWNQGIIMQMCAKKFKNPHLTRIQMNW